MPDADINTTVNALLGAAFGGCRRALYGASTIAVTIDDATADKLVEALVPRVKALRYGDGIPERWRKKWISDR